ncbi:ROK family protein [Aureimonas phyllosphaerae]|uniref:Putative NBD/HSP70 family sugar kinase n=1 Tax=Aureimonas phyllosphaerae TaxID=1166078 RepID=A0A7W6BU06_9HYPH|nr:ROK family protein [Aureimonas phyllosphaerae]MBB3937986.1 putative NBD/HSP70 family sugar kinase [Aureimonas phyllosphaerae]MBB3961969.1 putative NBD/HSP70 family sugar kinase [Aureimonas phyllosphaerae]SFF52882.1 Sugar kinase of the NBD/HSP70 family, may contain an N-terminal HTH domain [Aureimonas phyllosphaerae]
MASRRASDEGASVSRGEPVSLGAERVRALEAERQSLVSILGTLRNAGPATRLDLERETHLGRAVIVDRLATLSAFGLVEENGVGRSIGGRAPKLLRFRAEAGRLLVANMDGSTVGIGLADLSGRLLLEHYEDVAPDLPSPSLLERLETLFAWALGEGGAPLWGIGLGAPGTVDFEQEVQLAVPRFATSPDWNESRLVERLAVRFGAPVFARSAVQTATMGEITALPPERAFDLIFVDLGPSISTGLVSGGQLLRGAQGIAGQMGHIYMGEGSMLVCGCGNVGCLQTVAGCEAIAREGERAASEGQSPALAAILARSGAVTVDDIGTASRLGDPFSADILAQAGRLVGTTLAGLVNIFNPATLVIGGDLAQTGDICLAAIREAVYRHAQPLASRDLSILRSRMGRSAGLVGAATVVAEELFASHFLEAWITSGTPLAHPKVLTFLQAAAGAA